MHPYALSTESSAYRSARDRLLQAEMALRDQREQVAQLRRSLPPGPLVQDYLFREGPADLSRNDPREFFDTRLSQLFSPGKGSLIVYHFMFGKAQYEPCPMCTMWIDGFNGVAPHIEQRADFAIVAAADAGRLRKYGRSRGWRNLRLVSAGDSTFKRDLDSETEDGAQLPYVSVFRRNDDGEIVHFYSANAMFGPHQMERGVDLLSPVWNMFDLTPEGRGEDWYPSVRYR